MGKGSAPPPPDYEAAAEATSEGSQRVATQQTYANRPNVTTPWGSLNWAPNTVTDPSTGESVTQWSGNMSLTPAQQAALDSQQAVTTQRSNTALGMGQQVQDAYANPMDWSGIPQGGSAVTANQNTRDARWDGAGQGLSNVNSGQYQGQTGFNQPTQGTYGQAGGNRPGTLFGFNNSGPGMRDSFGQPTTGMQSNVQGGGLQYGAGGAGQGMAFGGAGGAGQGLQYGAAGAGQGISYGGFGAGQGIQSGGLGQREGIQGSMNDTAGGWRQRAQDAVAGLQDPYLKNARSAKETQLLNQGITQGSEAWKNAQMELGDSESRAGLQAIASGRDEASMLFGQDLSSAQFVNQAQEQGFGQAARAGEFGNNAQSQAWNQRLGEGQFGNNAQAQAFGQNVTNVGLNNQAQQTAYNQRASDVGLTNAAQGQAFGQNVTNVGLNNQAQGQGFNQGMANATLSNQVNQQEYNQSLGEAQFANSANQQGYNQALQGAQFGNQAIQGDYDRSYSDATLANSLNQQQFNQGLATGNFANSTLANNFGMENTAAQTNNAAQQQSFDQQFKDIAYNDQQANQNQANEISAGSYNNMNQQQAVALALQQRNQPLNEMNSLLTGQQVQQPNFPGTTQAQMAQAPNYLDAANQSYSGQLDSFGVQQAQKASNTQAAASAAMTAAMFFSDKRLKKDITKLFTLPNGINVYSYRFIGNDSLELGVLAQEVAEIMPEAVAADDKGFLKVNYNMVLS